MAGVSGVVSVSAEGVAGVGVGGVSVVLVAGVSVSGVGDTLSFLPSFLPFLRLLNIRLICSGQGSPLVAGGVLVAGAGDTLGLGIGLPLPLVTVAGVSVVLGGVAGVGVVSVSAEGVAGVSATLVHMVSVVLGGVSAEGVAGVGDTRCFLLGDRSSLKFTSTHSVCGVRVIVWVLP